MENKKLSVAEWCDQQVKDGKADFEFSAIPKPSAYTNSPYLTRFVP